MEDNIQTIIVVIISAFILFIFPVYMAYEKKDDISYALAMRYTQDLVDEVRSKGYITKNMYEDYRARLKVTGNTYDIQMTHEYNRYDPITNYYSVEGNKYNLVKTTTREEKNEYISSEEYALKNITKVEDTYMLSTEVYTTEHIVGVLDSERKLLLNSDTDNIVCSDDEDANDGCQYAYIMNAGDNFNITIKNTNITPATIIYNMVTANTLDVNTRIYVNYGGAILSTRWYGDIDYAKMKHDNISITEQQDTVVFEKVGPFAGNNNITENIAGGNTNLTRYVIEFEAKPEAVTELREKGTIRQVADWSGYNFAFGRDNQALEGSENKLYISVGLNGISLLSDVTVTEKKKFYLLGKNTILDENGVETEEEVQRNLSDYKKIEIAYDEEESKLLFRGTLKNNSTEVDEKSASNIWKYLNTITRIDNLGIDGFFEYYDNYKDAGYEYGVEAYEKSILLTATNSNKKTLLSYATSIDSYIKIKVEFVKNKDKFVAYLYINEVKVAESIQMDIIPKVNVIGKAVIDGQEKAFDGQIRNVKIYEMGD